MQTLYSVSSHPVYYILSIPVYFSLCNVLFTNVHCTCTHVLGSTDLPTYGIEEIAPRNSPEVKKFGLGGYTTSAIGYVENQPGAREEKCL